MGMLKVDFLSCALAVVTGQGGLPLDSLPLSKALKMPNELALPFLPNWLQAWQMETLWQLAIR